MGNSINKRIIVKRYKPKGKRVFRYVMKCLYCGKNFEILPRDYNRGRGIYCNDKCNSKRKNGKYNGRWKGGVQNSMFIITRIILLK